jgi:hypothetical protein
MGLKLVKILSQLSLIMLFLCNYQAYAAWNGPQVVVQGSWGSGEQEFGYRKGDIRDVFPDSVIVLSDGKIVVLDELSEKLKIFRADGTFLKSIQVIAIGFYRLDLDSIVGGKLDDKGKTKIGVYNISTEKWLWIDNSTDIGYLPDLTVYISDANHDIYIWNNHDKGYRYSSTGTILDTYSTRPLIFGQEVSSQKKSDGNYSTVIRFDDMMYGCKTPTTFDSFTRDSLGYLYGIAHPGRGADLHYRVYKVTKCGNTIATLDFPPDKSHAIVIHDPPPATDIVTVDEEYGKPVIAPNGDVYTWKRTPDNYSILKWTWVDDPNTPSGPDAPTGLSAMPSTTGIYLTWTASAQDPGCVTGYEVAQATTSGGPYTTLTTMTAGMLKYNDTSANAGTTYYYKVRAKSGSDYSPYSREASGKR